MAESSSSEASMIARREWFRRTITNALAAWGASCSGWFSNSAFGQSTPSKKGTTGRYTVRKPALPNNKTATPASGDLATLPIRARRATGEDPREDSRCPSPPRIDRRDRERRHAREHRRCRCPQARGNRADEGSGSDSHRLVHQGDDRHSAWHAGRRRSAELVLDDPRGVSRRGSRAFIRTFKRPRLPIS